MSAVAVESEGRVVTATIASPPANALSEAVASGLADALDTVERERAKVLVIRSGVPGYFVAGADLKHVGTADADGFEAYLALMRAVIERLAALDAVSIAAVDGYALGGGLELAVACTFRVASAEARLGVPEVKLGILPGAGGTQRLPRFVGRGVALDLMLTGRSVKGEEALRLGLVDRLAHEGTAAEAAGKLAAELAALSGPALAAIVRCVDAAQSRPLDEGMELELAEIRDLFAGPDAREGITAFLEKRPPKFA